MRRGLRHPCGGVRSTVECGSLLPLCARSLLRHDGVAQSVDEKGSRLKTGSCPDFDPHLSNTRQGSVGA